ncbi:MAG: GntR family transcriptional regulator [Microbacteriaceae bacterium]|nr:GntR family transcriptional regulator [Microbacteriaceae bacterium]
MFEFGPGLGGVDREAGAALHAQISDALRARIVSGDLARDHRLPPEPELAEEIGVSRGTLRRALATLIDEGLLTQIPGRGTFVTSAAADPGGERLSTLSEDFASQGIPLDTRVLSSEAVVPPADVAGALQLAPGALALRLVRVRSTGSSPIALLHNYVRLDLAPGLETVDFAITTLFGALEGRYGLPIASARRSFSAVVAHGEVADALGLDPGMPVQYLEQLTFLADGRAIEYSDVWIDSRQLRVVTRMTRTSAASAEEKESA